MTNSTSSTFCQELVNDPGEFTCPRHRSLPCDLIIPVPKADIDDFEAEEDIKEFADMDEASYDDNSLCMLVPTQKFLSSYDAYQPTWQDFYEWRGIIYRILRC
jgi:hypothetical protein